MRDTPYELTEKALDDAIEDGAFSWPPKNVWGNRYKTYSNPVVYAGKTQIEFYKKYFEWTDLDGRVYVNFDKPKQRIGKA